MNDWLDAETRIERVQQLTEMQQWPEALDELDAALAINPDDPTWHAQRGQLLDLLERYDEAVEAYRRALTLSPDHHVIQTAMGIDLIRVGRHTEAVAQFEEITRDHPTYEPAYCNRIAAYARMAEHERAEEMFYLAQQLTQECPNCFHHIAESLTCRAMYDRAIYCWKRCLEIEPNYPHARVHIAEAYRALGQADKAQEFYVNALRQDPGNIEVLSELGDLLIEKKDFTGAAAKFRHILDLEPDSLRPHVMLGLLASRNEDLDAAVHHFETALAGDEHYPGLRSHLGEAELRRDNHYTALRHLSLAIEDDPDDIIGQIAMGNCLLQLSRPEEAEEHFERVIALDSTMVSAHHNLAVCRFLDGDFADGIEHCLNALEAQPDNVMVMYKLALAYVHLGKWREAREIIDRGLATEPNHAELQTLRKRLPWIRIRHLIARCLPWLNSGHD